VKQGNITVDGNLIGLEFFVGADMKFLLCIYGFGSAMEYTRVHTARFPRLNVETKPLSHTFCISYSCTSFSVTCSTCELSILLSSSDESKAAATSFPGDLVSMLFADLLSLHLVTFLMFLFLYEE